MRRLCILRSAFGRDDMSTGADKLRVLDPESIETPGHGVVDEEVVYPSFGAWP
jgi:hypothetical protein